MSPDLKRRVTIFKKNRRAVVALWFMIFLLLAGLGSELISNSAPIVGQVQGKVVFPAYVQYDRSLLGLQGAGVIDYRELKSEFDWAIWPLLGWDPYEIDSE